MTENVDQLSGRVAASLIQPLTDRSMTGLYRPLLRLLARGTPVTTGELATAAGLPEPGVAEAVAGWADTEYDQDGRIIGYGLTLRETSHRFTVAGQRLYTWCALDTLIFPAILDHPAEVESPCHATGAPIRLHVDPTGGVTALEPSTAVVSIVTLDEACTSVRSAFCNQVHFFTDHDAATGWLNEHPGMGMLPVAEAYRLGRPLIDTLLGDSDPATCPPS